MNTRGIEVHKSTVLLVAIGFADLFTTIYWLVTGCAVEANPVMAWALGLGMPVFIGLKVSTLMLYMAGIEWYRRREPERAHTFSTMTIVMYLVIYTVSFCLVNPSLFG